jgi:tryptophan synthase beta chain
VLVNLSGRGDKDVDTAARWFSMTGAIGTGATGTGGDPA